jgi:hypothetical protein
MSAARLSPERADGTDDGSSGGKRGHKPGGDGKDALGHRKDAFDGRDEPLPKEVLLMRSVGTEIHFIGCVGVLGSKGVMIHGYIIIIRELRQGTTSGNYVRELRQGTTSGNYVPSIAPRTPP